MRGIGCGLPPLPHSLQLLFRPLTLPIVHQVAVVNVYVPNESSGCSRLPYKTKFLAGLSRIMAQLKADGKPWPSGML